MKSEIVGILIKVPHLQEAKAYYRDCLKLDISEDAPHYFSVVVDGPLKLAFLGSNAAGNELSIYVRGAPGEKNDDPVALKTSAHDGASYRRLVDPNNIEIVFASDLVTASEDKQQEA
ncbi:MAG: hypothetical protein WA958_12575 [Tunicatimonas sp.]